MKVKFENDRLQMLPEGIDEERFAKMLVRRMEDSNNFTGWYGDMEFDNKGTSGYVITWQLGKSPKDIPSVEKVETK